MAYVRAPSVSDRPAFTWGPPKFLTAREFCHRTSCPSTPRATRTTLHTCHHFRATCAPSSNMLDAFEILTTSGIVLWRKEYSPVSSNVINSLISDVFIEERGGKTTDSEGRNAPYKKDKYTLRWTSAKDVGLIFVVGKSRLLEQQKLGLWC